MWVKLTECNHRCKTELISNPQELYRFLATPGIDVANLLFDSDDVVWVSWKYAAEERISKLPHTNEVIGSFVTAGALCLSRKVARDSNLHRYRLCHIHTK
jgi:hypothetical protein